MDQHKLYLPLAITALIGYSLTFAARGQTTGYVETDLVVNRRVGAEPTLLDSDAITHIAKFFDPNLVNLGVSRNRARRRSGYLRAVPA